MLFSSNGQKQIGDSVLRIPHCAESVTVKRYSIFKEGTESQSGWFGFDS